MLTCVSSCAFKLSECSSQQTCINASMLLLTRNPRDRLGCGANGEREICQHQFYRCIDWPKLTSRQVQPPFKPQIVRLF
ncbi:hypothetical protein AHF37_03955 [Paragonimus kellicotti]|nr:hypothetical protein AHF37_03955 [Paragonimus kellicotti]